MPPKQKQKQKLTIAFDLYGTILDTSSIATDIATTLALPQETADQLAAKWRQYQLEYTWRLTAQTQSAYAPFDALTRAALLHAAKESAAGLQLTPAQADDLMHAYDSLQTFPDVLPALKTLSSDAVREKATAVVFSNGTPEMLARSVATAPTLKLFQGSGGESADDDDAPVFEKLLSVHAVKRYKPAPEAYAYLQREAPAPGSDSQAQIAVWLVSSNAFDILGARAAGIRAAWVDRSGTGWVDQLGAAVSEAEGAKMDLTPTLVVKGVDEAVEKILAVGV